MSSSPTKAVVLFDLESDGNRDQIESGAHDSAARDSVNSERSDTLDETLNVANVSMGFRARRDTMTLGIALVSPKKDGDDSNPKEKGSVPIAKPVRRRRDSHCYGKSAVTAPAPVESPRPLGISIPNFVEAARGTKSRVPCFGLFASLDEPSFDELCVMYRTHTELLHPLIKLADATLTEMLPAITLLEWLNGTTRAPEEVTLSCAILLWPLTTLYQLCSFLVAQSHLSNGVSFEHFREALSTGGLLTLGKGIIAAIAVASSRTLEEFLRNAVIGIRSSFLVGSVHEANNTLLMKKTRGHPNRFQMHVVNIPLHSLKVLVDTVNDASSLPEGVRAMGDVILSHVLSPRAAVLCGHPLDLCRLEKAIMDFTDETGVKIMKTFLCKEGPELSDYYCRRLCRDVYNVWVDHNIFYSHHDLTIEVFSPVDGHPLSAQSNLMEIMTRLTTYQPHNLMNSVGHVQGQDNVIDFGPGALSARVSFFLRWMNSQSEVICSPAGIVLPKQAPSPKRSSKSETRASTFAKCAILNDIISSLYWEGKPDALGTDQLVELNSTFLEMGLLVSINSKLALDSNPDFLRLDSPKTPPSKKAPGESISTYKGVAVQPIENFVMTSGDTVRIGQVDETFENLQICQHVLLTTHAVHFVVELNQRCDMDFPQHALLLCKDVAALLEYWDTLEFVARRFMRSMPTTEATKLMSRGAARKNKMLHMVRQMFSQNNGVMAQNSNLSFDVSFRQPIRRNTKEDDQEQ